MADRRVIGNGPRWRDAPKDCGPQRTIDNRFVRWRRLGLSDRTFAELAAMGGGPERLMIDATHLKAHRTAASRLKKGAAPVLRGNDPLDRFLILGLSGAPEAA